VSGPSSSLQREEHGPVARLLLIAVGLLFILAGALLFGDALWMLLSEPRRFLALLLLALFGAIVVYGCILLRRGLAGWSEGALARDDAKVRRRFAEWIPFLGLVLGVMAWTSTAGRVPPLGFLWYLAVSLAFFPISAAIHELGHLIPGCSRGGSCPRSVSGHGLSAAPGRLGSGSPLVCASPMGSPASCSGRAPLTRDAWPTS